MSNEGGGRLLVISGPSGVGKSSVCDRLAALSGCRRIVTATTRSPRAGERDGVHYRFLGREEFEDGIRRGDFLEHAEVHGQLYGTPRSAVAEAIRNGECAILAIDVQGAEQIRRQLESGGRGEKGRGKAPADDAGLPGGRLTTVFLMPPNEATLEARLRGRRTEAAANLAVRLEAAKREMKEREKYDHVVVNDDLEETVGRLAAIVRRKMDQP